MEKEEEMKGKEQTTEERLNSTKNCLLDSLITCADNMSESPEERTKLIYSFGIPATLSLLQTLTMALSAETSADFASKVIDYIVKKMNTVKEEMKNETEN